MGFPAGIINFEVYEDGVNFLGIAKITFPDAQGKKLTLNGAGIFGDVDIPVIGSVDAMSVKIEFTDAPEAAYKLNEARVHMLDCRAAHEEYDATEGRVKVKAYKHILEVAPTSLSVGSAAPASAQGMSSEYSCISRKDYIDGALMLHIDPIRGIYVDASGTDRLAEVRSALGK